MRGYQKRVVYLKNTGSSVFEEAYFVIKSDKLNQIDKKRYIGEELIEEANRIIEENKKLYERKTLGLFNFKNILIFGIGFLCSSVIFSLIYMI